MAPPARLELTTLRLGGVRSILVSYGGMVFILAKNPINVNQIRHIFLLSMHIIAKNLYVSERRICMEGYDPNEDIDDMIFGDEESYPSDR